MKIAIGSDHRGMKLRESVLENLKKKGHEVIDVGAFEQQNSDYPDFALKVARLVADGGCERGVMIDGAGVGSAIVANKVPGVRAVCGNDYFIVLNSRKHNNTNLLTLGSEVTGAGKTMELLELWLATGYEGGRHQPRIDKITAIEKMFSVSLSGIEKLIAEIISGFGISGSGKAAPQSLNKKLVTIEDLKNFSGKELTVGTGTIITPLARDYLKDKNITVVRK